MENEDREFTPLEAWEKIKYNLSEDVTSDLPEALETIETILKKLPLLEKDLNEYHKIEEKLGIDLVTFFRIRKHCYDEKPIFYKKNNKIIESNTMVECDYSRVSVMLEEFKYLMFPFKKYGKTWALTKEELL